MKLPLVLCRNPIEVLHYSTWEVFLVALCNLLSMEVGQEEVFVARHGLLLLLEILVHHQEL